MGLDSLLQESFSLPTGKMRSAHLLTFLPLLVTCQVWDPAAQNWQTNNNEVWEPSLSQNWQKTDGFDRTIDLSSLGLDFNDVFDQLLSPKGIIEQFVLSIGLQVMNVGGYVITGLVYAFLVGVTPAGPLLDTLKFFEIILTPQAILITSVRAVLSLVWELAARVITTTLLFGVFESVSQTLASTTLEGLWNFLTSTTLKQIMIMRFVFFTIFAIVGMSILNALGPMPFDITTLIPIGRQGLADGFTDEFGQHSKSIGEGLFGENGGLEQILQSMIHQAKDFLVMPDLDLASA